jgi:nucleoside-diphosphate-sugar epimerase
VNGTHGNQVRDFIHADDGADACIALLDSRLSGPFNVGTGRGCSLREVAAVIVAELERGELLRFGEREASARGLKEGIRLTIEAKVHELKKKSA